jgi:DNA-directed RNA polymerase subunit RPC12/RpoP
MYSTIIEYSCSSCGLQTKTEYIPAEPAESGAIECPNCTGVMACRVQTKETSSYDAVHITGGGGTVREVDD